MNDNVLDAVIDTMVYVYQNNSDPCLNPFISNQPNEDNSKDSSLYLIQFQGNI